MMRESMEDVVAARYLAYSFFARTFEAVPNEGYLALLREPALREAFLVIAGGQMPACLDDLFEAIEALEGEDSATVAERLSGDYTRLFVGPDSLPGRPWECVHRSGRNEILQSSTLEVRRFYRKAGYLPAAYRKVSDDFLPIEVSFLAALAEETAKKVDAAASAAEKSEGIVELCALQKEFLDEHVLRWLPSYLDELNQSDARLNCAFYKEAAASFAWFCERDSAVLSELR